MNTILLIDDSRLVRTLMERDLTRAGYRVITAIDGESGLRLAQQHHPDLVLLDMLLPKIAGLDVLRALKADSNTRDISVIVLTRLSKDNADRLRRSGATAFFEKSDSSLQSGSNNLIRLIEEVLASPSNPASAVPAVAK
ncbi:MAG TPA: response regulator [Terriglobales bacterium]|nr:response regulator [Terriglobales bacterium]